MKNTFKSDGKNINKSIQKKADVLKASVTKTSEGASDALDKVNNKTEAVKKDIKDGFSKASSDIGKTVKKTGKDLKKN